MTIKKTHSSKRGSFKHRLRTLFQGENIWLRPATATVEEMLWLCSKVDKDINVDYLEFMIHSSELMPGGSPYFKDDCAIENLYMKIEKVFEYVQDLGYEGITMIDYCNNFKDKGR